jgi:hypothetical protein
MRPRENKITFLFCDIARLQVFLANIYSEKHPVVWLGPQGVFLYYFIILYGIFL